MPTKLLTALAVTLTLGCAAGGRSTLPAEEFGDPDRGLELVVTNERNSTVTAYIQWQGSREVRLGEVRSRRTETFTTPMRGRDMRVTFGSPGSRAGQAGSGYVVVTDGDRMQWTLTTSGVFYRRLVPN